MIESIDPRPDVGILSMMRNYNFQHSFALAEFIDNSLESFDNNEKIIKSIDGETTKLNVDIRYQNNKLIIKDNAGGIKEEDYQRSFTAGVRPPKTSGRSEFGVGMKIAACWYSNNWTVETTAIGEDVKRVINWDMTQIPESVPVAEYPADPNQHYTIITLDDLHRKPHGRGYETIRKELASIYRTLLKEEYLKLSCLGDTLSFPDIEILNAPPYQDTDAPSKLWKIPINFQLSTGMHVNGFAALRSTGTAMGTGFSLFRRGRLIVDHYDHQHIFGGRNTATFQRLFGELHLEGVEVTFTKNEFYWSENEENIFLDRLKTEVEELRAQAQNHRYRPSKSEPTEDIDTTEPEPTEDIDTTEPEPTEDTDTSEPEPVIDSRAIEEVTIDGETRQIYVDQHVIYFHQLPLGGVIKIGVAALGDYDYCNRIIEAQRYFENDIKPLGVISYDDRTIAEEQEKELLDRFGRVNIVRRECELVRDNDEVRTYIKNQCKDPRFYEEASRRSRSGRRQQN